MYWLIVVWIQDRKLEILMNMEFSMPFSTEHNALGPHHYTRSPGLVTLWGRESKRAELTFSVILTADAQVGLCYGLGWLRLCLILRFHQALANLLLLHKKPLPIYDFGAVFTQEQIETREEERPGTQAWGSFPLPPILPSSADPMLRIHSLTAGISLKG